MSVFNLMFVGLTLTAPLPDACTPVLTVAGQAYTVSCGGVVTPPNPNPPPNTFPVIPNMPPKGVQWHPEYRLSDTTNAHKNFNWLMDGYGSSWGFSYVYRSPSGLSNDFQIAFADGAAIINTFGGAGNFGPSGMFIPYAPSVVGQTFKAYNNLNHTLLPVVINLPYPDTN